VKRKYIVQFSIKYLRRLLGIFESVKNGAMKVYWKYVAPALVAPETAL
jgi:hypothetical protein